MSPVANVWVGGVDLGSLGVFEEIGSLWATPPRRGSGYVLPDSDGEVPPDDDLPMAAYDVSFGVVVYGTAVGPDASFAQVHAAWLRIEQAVDTGAPVAIMRVLGALAESTTALPVTAAPEFRVDHARISITAHILEPWVPAVAS